MKEALPSITAVLMAIVGVALLAVIVSNKSDTNNVITKFGQNFAKALRCAAGPVLGGGSDCGYPASVSLPPITIPTGVANSTIVYQ